MTRERVLQKTVLVGADRRTVFDAWTTRAGVRTFFGPDARVFLNAGGAYEITFLPEAPEGERGSEGCKILRYHAPFELVFSWNFPPSLPAIRYEFTEVRVRFDVASDFETMGFMDTLDTPVVNDDLEDLDPMSTMDSGELPSPPRRAHSTRVTLVHSGWRDGEDWDEGFAYFDRAWALVLARLRHSFEVGPIDWSDPYAP